jgi:hypothetical protein
MKAQSQTPRIKRILYYTIYLLIQADEIEDATVKVSVKNAKGTQVEEYRWTSAEPQLASVAESSKAKVRKR